MSHQTKRLKLKIEGDTYFKECAAILSSLQWDIKNEEMNDLRLEILHNLVLDFLELGEGYEIIKK